PFGLDVRDGVVLLLHAPPADEILAAGRLEAGGRCHRIDVLGNDPVRPAGEVAAIVETRLQRVMRHRPRTRSSEVVLAREDELHRLFDDAGDHCRLYRRVRPDAPTEAAATELQIDLDLVRRGLE